MDINNTTRTRENGVLRLEMNFNLLIPSSSNKNPTCSTCTAKQELDSPFPSPQDTPQESHVKSTRLRTCPEQHECLKRLSFPVNCCDLLFGWNSSDMHAWSF
ncbi:unnamed protein product [Pleuronectes platessa]|uniref:Uncharacterized protein n=1 Tax=Pleuronectes platessa TaxID=8262 RepID=A0A9N7V537_PLEPL|nr:unnamed protein product [Pleuronectes platessa]